jgi:hypothetical protein
MVAAKLITEAASATCREMPAGRNSNKIAEAINGMSMNISDIDVG